MLSRIHQKLGAAGLVVAIVALIVALAGTAIAAVGLNSKQKKEVTKIAKKFAGKQGPAGSQGVPGAAGAKGATGPAGSKGATGPAGSKGATGPAGATGEEGPPGPTETVLPAGKTSTGDWAFAAKGHADYLVINFPLKVVPAPEYHWLGKEGTNPNCPGTDQEPKAAPGHLCIYALEVANVEGPNLIGSSTADKTSGWVGEFVPKGEAEGYGFGSWAVKAACPKDKEGNEIPC
jgi:collagen triple helix repeat protein